MFEKLYEKGERYVHSDVSFDAVSIPIAVSLAAERTGLGGLRFALTK
jgi:hypothetical protein